MVMPIAGRAVLKGTQSGYLLLGCELIHCFGRGADPYVSMAVSYFSLPLLRSLSLSLSPTPSLSPSSSLTPSLPSLYFQELPAFLEFTINFFLISLAALGLISGRILSSGMGALNGSMWSLAPRPPALEVWSLSHWTTREVPVLCCVESLLCIPWTVAR